MSQHCLNYFIESSDCCDSCCAWGKRMEEDIVGDGQESDTPEFQTGLILSLA